MGWKTAIGVALLGTAVLGGCEEGSGGPPFGGGSPTPSPSPTPTPAGSFVVTVNFGNDATWTAGFADYSPGMEAQVAFASGLKQVPPNLLGTFGFQLAGSNPADDVSLYAWRKVTGLRPSTLYKIESEVEFATNAPAGCVGIGGAPGEAVTFKAGASDLEPALVVNGEGLLTLNLDKANQGESGDDAVAIGDIASAQAGTCDAPVYARKTLASNGNGPTVRSDAQGNLWLVLLTDSGYEGRTELYLLGARIVLTEA